jgi:hypothetical protein
LYVVAPGSHFYPISLTSNHHCYVEVHTTDAIVFHKMDTMGRAITFSVRTMNMLQGTGYFLLFACKNTITTFLGSSWYHFSFHKNYEYEIKIVLLKEIFQLQTLYLWSFLLNNQMFMLKKQNKSAYTTITSVVCASRCLMIPLAAYQRIYFMQIFYTLKIL